MIDTERMKAIVDAVGQLVAAVKIEGSHPAYHQAVMGRHRKEWPTLWAAIDDLVAIVDDALESAPMERAKFDAVANLMGKLGDVLK